MMGYRQQTKNMCVYIYVDRERERVVREGLTEKVTYEQILEEGSSHGYINP